MGADLYIKKMPREPQYTGCEVSDKAVDVGYFRDCYNSGGLFAFLTSNTNKEFSWWQLVDKKELFGMDGDMHVNGARKFLKAILSAKKTLNKKKVFYLKAWDGKEDKTKLDKDAVKYYLDWLDLLIKFLELAIEKRSEIIFSV